MCIHHVGTDLGKMAGSGPHLPLLGPTCRSWALAGLCGHLAVHLRSKWYILAPSLIDPQASQGPLGRKDQREGDQGPRVLLSKQSVGWILERIKKKSRRSPCPISLVTAAYVIIRLSRYGISRLHVDIVVFPLFTQDE